MEKNGLNENVKILFRGFVDFPEDNFCKMRQWNILEHMFIICNIRSDKTFTLELVDISSIFKSS